MSCVFGHLWNILIYIQGISVKPATRQGVAQLLEFALTREPCCSLRVENGSITIVLETRVLILVSREKIGMACDRDIENLSDDTCHAFISCMKGESGGLGRCFSKQVEHGMQEPDGNSY